MSSFATAEGGKSNSLEPVPLLAPITGSLNATQLLARVKDLVAAYNVLAARYNADVCGPIRHCWLNEPDE